MPAAAILGCEGPVLGAAEARLFARADPCGFILFRRNVESPDQLRRLTADLRAAVGRHAPIFVDQEGGRVRRLRPPHWADVPAALTLAAGGAAALAAAYGAIADELAAVGIDANCAPVADIAHPGAHGFLGDRCLGHDTATVIAHARAVADAHLAKGILPVPKHAPGHGRATADSHGELPRIATDLATLEATDFAVFRALRDLPAMMTGHVVFEALDPERPATTSPTVVAYIREAIGFTGLLVTDDLSMEALAGPVETRAAAAVAAGCDLALHCNGVAAEAEAVAAAAGPMSAAARDRAARARPEPAHG